MTNGVIHHVDILRSCNLLIIRDNHNIHNHADNIVDTPDITTESHNANLNNVEQLSNRASIPVPIQYCPLDILNSDLSIKNTILKTFTSNHHEEATTSEDIVNFFRN